MSCIMTENVLLNPKEYKMIEIRPERELDGDQVVLVEPAPELYRKMTIYPALVKFHQNRAI